MKIALIGATGFVASAILKEGLQRGHEVPGDRSAPRRDSSHIRHRFTVGY